MPVLYLLCLQNTYSELFNQLYIDSGANANNLDSSSEMTASWSHELMDIIDWTGD